MVTRHIRFAGRIAGGVAAGLLCAAAASAGTVTVGDYAALTNAIAVCADGDTISLTNSITVSAQVAISAKGLTLEGNHHTISVPVPSLDESGFVTANASAFRVFNISAVGKTSTLRNLTVKGGSPAGEGGGILNNGGTLVLEGVTVTRSGGSGYGGGGVANDTGTLFMRDCTINRNTAKNGGGFFNISAGAKMFIERCTLSDNRCMSGAGGGAGENKALLYVNNSTFANNACNELGGAFNNYIGTAYLVGCTFVGNMAYGGQMGGAVANNGGTVTLVSSLFAYNYHNSGGTYVLNDIANYSGAAPVAYGCVFQSATNQLGVGSVGTTLYTGNATGSDDGLFAGGTGAKALAADGKETGTGTFYQPFLWKTGAALTPTAVLKSGGFAVNKGVRSAFFANAAPPVVGYYSGSAWAALSGSNPASHEVTTDQDNVARSGSPTAGAVVSSASGLCRLKVTAADHGTVSGGTIYGDTYLVNTTVTLTAIPAPGYKLSAWDYVLGGSGVASAANPFAVTLTTNVTLLPVFAPSAPAISAPPTNQVLAVGGTLAVSVTAASIGSPHFQWFKNGAMVSGATNSTLTRACAAVTDSGVYTVAITNAYGLSLSTPVTVMVGAPHLFSWGWNNCGQLGDGTLRDRNTAVSVADHVVAAFAGSQHSLFVKGDGTLWAVGQNGSGQLGDGTWANRSNAVFVASNVVAASAGQYHSLFVKSDGTLWGMGWSSSGQLGDGTWAGRSIPVSVASNVVAVAAGFCHSLFLKGDGTLWAMGWNGYGQLGDGTMIDRNIPVPVASNVVAMAAGKYHSLFVKSDSTLWTTGRNSWGQLGDGTTLGRSNAVAVASEVTALAAGSNHSLFVTRDGTLRGMGLNEWGPLGDGTGSSRSNAVFVAENATAVAAGETHSLFLKGEGTLWVTGGNILGQLGDGTAAMLRSTPVCVPGMSLASVVSGSVAAHTLAVGMPLPLTITLSPTNQTVAALSPAAFTVAASGFAPLAYQWYFNNGAISGATATNYSLARVTAFDAGSYRVVVSNPEGSVTSGVAVLSVNLVASSVAVSASTNTSVYGDRVTFTASVAPGTASGTVTFKDGATTLGTGTLTNGTVIFATRDLSAGDHSITAEYGGDGDHAVSGSVPLSQTVGKAVLTAAALPQTRAYGVANPELTFTLSGYVNGEGAGAVAGLPSLTTDAVSGSTVGDYAIDVAQGDLSAANYRFAFVQGTLTITKASASVILHGLSQICDGAPKSVTATTTPEGLTVAITYGGSSTAPAAAGSYAVLGTVSEVNWQGSAGGTLTLDKRTQTVTFAVIAPQPRAAAVGLAATASSGLPVSFNVLSGPGAIAGNTNLTFSAAGIVAVAAAQAGNAIYGAAPDVTNLVFVYTVIPDNGPLQGGNAVTINSGNPGTITNVQVGGVSAGIQSIGTNGLTLTMPAIGSAGIKDIVVQTADNGDFTLTGAYKVNPAGWIGGSRLEPSGWEGFGSGLAGSSVTALALDGTNLYAGGDFTTAGGVAANRVALWNGTGWARLGSGVAGSAVYALAHDGANLYAGGDFTNAGGVAANSVARWNGTVWTSLGSGLNGTVRALALDGQNLYAGGTFTAAGGVAAGYVAMWNGTAWTNLGSGVDSWVRALAHDGANLYAGGYFTSAGGVAANHVARWNGTSWEPLGGGLNNDVRALTLVGPDLVAGGDFTTAGDKAANAVARWDGAGWTALGSGMNDSVTALAQDGVNLYAGGFFTAAGVVGANYVAMWDGAGWTELGCGMSGAVKALAHDGTDLVAGGDFTVAGGVPVNRVAVWGETLISLSGVEPASGALAGGYTVTISGTNLCNGSDVTGVTLCGVAASSIQSQSATQIVVTAGAAGFAGPGDVRICSVSFGETVKADAFTYLADQTVSFAPLAPQPLAAKVGLAATASSGLPVSYRVVSGPGSIADNTNLTFSAAGMVAVAASQAGDAGFGAAPDVTNRFYVYTVVPDNGPLAGGNAVSLNSGYPGRLITSVQVGGAAAVQAIEADGLTLTMPATGSAGVKDIVVHTADAGDFTLAGAYTVNPAGQIGGSVTGPHVWTGLGSGFSGSAVYALAFGGTNLYAGGTFTMVGGSAVNDAQWGGTGWSDLGSGMDDTVTALAYDGANLYAGGYFTSAGGVPANYVAMWDGSVWKSLGSGLDGPVSALVCDGANLYAGGAFTTAGGVAANRVAVWNGTSWAPLGSGMAGSIVTALAHDGTNLYAGGDFTKAGGVAASRVARWNGTGWSGLGSGMNGTVFALERDGGTLVAGGAFTTAGGRTANRVARWDGAGWTGLGDGMNDTVRALTHDGTNLYAGGYFTLADGVAANYVARWNGTGWTGLGSGLNSWVRSLAHDGTGLYAGGYFTAVGGGTENYVARWAPSVITYASVTPASGSEAGGYRVVISGANLCNGSDVTRVTICGVSAAIQSQTATQIVVTAGTAVAIGPGDVHVCSASYGETLNPGAFTYLAAPVWNPQMQGGAGFGVWSNQFGFNITGSSNLAVVVEACTNLAAPVWVPVETNILTGGPFYFSDPAWTNFSARFYRLSRP